MLTGVILAGGKNARMGGKQKALLPFSDGTLIMRQIRVMKPLCSELILVTNEPKPFLSLLGSTIRIITDYIPGKGPLSGMHAAFTLASNPDVWVVGCDMPFVSAGAAEVLWSRMRELRRDAAVPHVAGDLHPLHGLYRKSCASAIDLLFDAGEYRVTELLNAVRCEKVTEELLSGRVSDFRFVADINTPEDYVQALRCEAHLQLQTE